MFLPYKISSVDINKLVYGKELNSFFLRDQQKIHQIIRESVDKNQIVDTLINGSRLQETWFPVDDPMMNFDVFISHSHKDIDKYVKPFASWLYDHLGLRCFIDSEFWLFADDLLRILDDIYALDSTRKIYNYRIRNYTTSHIHAMLSMALLKMMAKTECVLFVDSDNSIKYTAGQADTPSPWIYEEICFANNLEIKIPDRLKKEYVHINEEEQRSFSSRDLNIHYKVDIDRFYNITQDLLNVIKSKKLKNHFALDFLHKKALAKFQIERRNFLFD